MIYEYTTKAKTRREDTEQTDILMTFDTDRATEVLSHAVKAYRQRSHIFAYDDLFPESTRPPFIKEKSEEHMMWHLLGVFFDHTKESRVLYRDLYFMIMDKPHMLSLEGIIFSDTDEVEFMLRRYLAHPSSRQDAVYLVQAMSYILDNYGNDLKNLLKGTKDLVTARKRLMELTNISDKKANLFLLYMIKYKLKEFDNPEELELAVDFHKVRASYCLGIVKFNVPSITGQVARRMVRVAYSDYMRNTQGLPFSIIDLDDMLWIIPAKVCSKATTSKAKDMKWARCVRLCPFAEKYCNGVIVRNDYKGYFDFTQSINPPNTQRLAIDIPPLTRQELLALPEHMRSLRHYENTPLVRQNYLHLICDTQNPKE